MLILFLTILFDVLLTLLESQMLFVQSNSMFCASLGVKKDM
jgi:hypothetical protein